MNINDIVLCSVGAFLFIVIALLVIMMCFSDVECIANIKLFPPTLEVKIKKSSGKEKTITIIKSTNKPTKR